MVFSIRKVLNVYFPLTNLAILRVRVNNQYKNVDELKYYLTIIQIDSCFYDKKKCR